MVNALEMMVMLGLGLLELESVGAGFHYNILVRNMTSWCALGRYSLSRFMGQVGRGKYRGTEIS